MLRWPLLRLAPAGLLVAGVLVAAAPARATGQSLSLAAGVSSLHDDNFLEYSDSQLRTFADGTHPLRFAVRSTDDDIFSPAASLTWELDPGGARRHAVRVRWDGDFHARNPGADRRSYGVRWTESFTGGRRLALGYGRVDDYYLRQLRDEDLPVLLGDARWQRAAFDEDSWSAGWRQAAGPNLVLNLGYRFERREYVPAFRERTSNAQQGELRLGWDGLPRHGELELSGGYRESKADATDGDAIAGDDDDVSYHGLLAGATARMELGRSGRVRLGGDLGVDVSSRHYDSERPVALDPFHAGRVDLLAAIEAGFRVAWRRWDARAFLRMADNRADLGSGAAPTSDSGSYHVDQFGLALSWSGSVWGAPQSP